MKSLWYHFSIILLSLSVLAQDKSKPAETPKDQPKPETQIFFNQSDPRCVLRYHDGEEYRFIQDKNVVVILNIARYPKYISAEVYVKNLSDQPIDLLPQNVFLDVIAPKEYAATQIPVAERIKSASKGSGWNKVLNGLASMAQQKSTSTIRDNQGNTIEVETAHPDTAAQSRARENIARQKAEQNEEIAAIQSSALKANTIFPDEMKGGEVQFKRDKEMQAIAFSVLVGAKYYTFAFKITKD